MDALNELKGMIFQPATLGIFALIVVSAGFGLIYPHVNLTLRKPRSMNDDKTMSEYQKFFQYKKLKPKRTIWQTLRRQSGEKAL